MTSEKVRRRIIALSDWLWPHDWPTHVRDALTGAMLGAIPAILFVVVIWVVWVLG